MLQMRPKTGLVFEYHSQRLISFPLYYLHVSDAGVRLVSEQVVHAVCLHVLGRHYHERSHALAVAAVGVGPGGHQGEDAVEPALGGSVVERRPTAVVRQLVVGSLGDQEVQAFRGPVRKK